MIRSFRDRETERLFRRAAVRKLPPDVRRVALRKLCFRWKEGDAEDVEIVDYH